MKHTRESSKTNWQHLHQDDDSKIDYNDIPETDESFWENAELLMPRPKKDL